MLGSRLCLVFYVRNDYMLSTTDHLEYNSCRYSDVTEVGWAAQVI